MLLDSAVGAWEDLRLAQRAEDAVEANLTTPCPGNVGVLLLAALGMAHGSDWPAVEHLAPRRSPSAWSATGESMRPSGSVWRWFATIAMRSAASWVRSSPDG
jgi:hypothetical protein